MSALVIPPRPRDLGDGMVVRRALPFAKKRMVGPFIFWDHMGPLAIDEKREMLVRPHPHIGLATLTYLLTGEIWHRDSLGNELPIRPGEVNWMTAGSGIVHSERASVALGQGGKTLEGIQLWLALPREEEERPASFVHIPEVPSLTLQGLHWKVIAGEFQGVRSPVPVYSELFYLEAKAPRGHQLDLKFAPHHESALYIARGSVEHAGESYGEGYLLVFSPGERMALTVTSDAQLFVFGGAPFPEGRLIWWNFVASSQEKIDQAKARWGSQQMGKVAKEDDWIPLPAN